MSFTTDYIKKKTELQQTGSALTLPSTSQGLVQISSEVKPKATLPTSSQTVSLPSVTETYKSGGSFSSDSGYGRGTTQESEGLLKTLTTPAKSGYFEGVSFLPSSPQAFVKDLGYQAERAGAGLLGAVEGITDIAGAVLGKGISGLFTLGGLLPENPNSQLGEDIASHFLNTSPTQAWKESINERYQPSIGYQRLGNITESIAQMLPSIGVGTAVSAGTSALNAANAASKGAAASKSLFGLQAAGSGAQQAASEGATTGQALTYGALSGLLETSIESIAGGVPGLGKGVLSDVANKVASNPLVIRALNVAGEGGEEALSTIITPYIQRAVYNADAENATADEIAESAVMGMVAAGALQGGIELPGAVSQIVDTRRSVGNTQDIINRVNQRLSMPGAVKSDFASSGLTLPTVQQQIGNIPSTTQTFTQQKVSTLPMAETAQQTTTQTEEVQPTSAQSQVARTAANVEIPVQDRTWQDAGNRKVNAFQFDHPELRPYYAEAARALKYDLSSAIKGERVPQFDSDGYITGYTGTKRSVTAPIEQALDNGGLSYDQIEKAIDNLIADNWQENYAAAKKLELVLDDMLANGYTDSDGYDVPPNQAYIAARDQANGTLPTTEYRMSEEEWASIMGQEQDRPVFLPEVGPESSVGAAQKGFDPWSAFQGTKSEFFPEGANAARPVDVPTTDMEGRNIRKTASTVMGAKAIPDQVVGEIQEMVLAGDMSYDRITDKAAIDRATRKLSQDGGFQRGMEEFTSAVRKGVVSKDLAALGQQLLVNAANAGDANATAELLTLYAQMETAAGQAVQAASILRKLSPTAQLYAAQKAASNLQETISKQLKGKDITIDTALIDEFNQQTTQEGRDAVMEKIYQNIADQVPSTWKDKWNAWRYLSMLGNPRTHIRNIVGNVGFQPVRIVKDRLASVIESGVSAASGGKLQRTKSFAYDPRLYASAWQDYQNVSDVLSGNKYDDIQSIINDKRTIFKTKPLEMARRGNSNLLSAEDMVFKHVTYADALAGYLSANGVTVEEFLKMKSEDGSKKKAIYQEAALPAGTRVRAADRNNFGEIVSFDEGTNKYLVHFVSPSGHEANVNLDASLVFPVNRSAQKVKVRNESGEVLPSFLQVARDYAGQEALKATYNDRNVFSDAVVRATRGLGTFGEAVLPFKRTPANILARGFEYSPLGLIKGLTYDLVKVKNGEMSGAQAIDNIAAGLTGSALMALGGVLAAAGFVSGGAGDDEKQAQWNELTGGQTYALNLPDGTSVTLDWLAPEALPFFMGVQAMQSFGEEGITADSISTAFASISEPMLEMSMLQSLNDLIDNVSYAASNEKLQGLVGSALISYLTQAIPTIGGQIERTGENKRYSTYTDKNVTMLPSNVQYAIGKASAKLPGLDYQQVPYIDAWGREETTGTLPMRAFNNFLNPAYTSSLNVTPVDEEVQRLYNVTGVGGVVPERPQKYITVNGERVDLTGDQYVTYATTRGQTAYSLMEGLLDNREYKSISDDEKAKAVQAVYQYADAIGKSKVSSYQPENWVSEAQNAQKTLGLSVLDYLVLRQEYGSILSGEKVQQAYQAGIPAKTYLQYTVQNKDTDGSGSVNNVEKISSIESSGMNENQKESLYQIEGVSDSAREKWKRAINWGLTAEDYQKYYSIYSGDGKKEDKLNKLQEAGMSAAQAQYFWDLMSKK